MNPHPQAPSADELQRHPIVVAALEAAWADSQTDSAAHRHEEDGWIYQHRVTGELSIRRAMAGAQASIDLNVPPLVEDALIVGKFHTHPNPTSEGWDPKPSRADQRIDAIHGVPDLIRADDGVYHSGPDRRRGGLGGEPGFPA